MDHESQILPGIRALVLVLLPQVKHMMHKNIMIVSLIFTTETPSVEQNQNTASSFVTAVVISIFIVYVLSSVLIFIVGCACGWFGHKHKAKGLNENTTATPGPVYEDIQPSTSMQGDPREKATFELKENVAYGPIQATQL